MLYVVHEPLTVCEASQQEGLSTVGTFGLTFLNPCSQAVLAGQLAAGGTHSGFFDVLKADVALQEGEVLAFGSGLHICYNRMFEYTISIITSVVCTS